ncbi:hypothetical protein SPMU_33070 [Sphingomonas mucosissima]|uniref:Uncharacterized protein n=1 Tax=Sphingomonas mucosissima TaxID=370959 RepID=A0A245ZDR2_9SPHN|nr:hypothetical protein SPMU_33070 [Sphingomonas mucosissima]
MARTARALSNSAFKIAGANTAGAAAAAPWSVRRAISASIDDAAAQASDDAQVATSEPTNSRCVEKRSLSAPKTRSPAQVPHTYAASTSCAAGASASSASHEPIDPLDLGPVRLDHHRARAVIVEQSRRDLRAFGIEFARAVRRLAKEHGRRGARGSDDIILAAEVTSRHRTCGRNAHHRRHPQQQRARDPVAPNPIGAGCLGGPMTTHFRCWFRLWTRRLPRCCRRSHPGRRQQAFQPVEDHWTGRFPETAEAENRCRPRPLPPSSVVPRCRLLVPSNLSPETPNSVQRRSESSVDRAKLLERRRNE